MGGYQNWPGPDSVGLGKGCCGFKMAAALNIHVVILYDLKALKLLNIDDDVIENRRPKWHRR